MGYWAATAVPLVLYHGNCADGFTAAWAVRKRFGDDGAEYVPCIHQEPPPDCKGRDVIFVDFSYKRDVMRQIGLQARSVLVLDHHKSAAEELPHCPFTAENECTVWRMDRPEFKNPTWEHVQDCVACDQMENVGRAMIYALFDMNRSGAGLAWDFFHPDTPRPALVNHVEDRDLWRFALPGTREIQAAVFSYPYDFGVWDMLARTPVEQLRDAGAAIERKHHKDIAELVEVCKRPMVISGHEVLVASLPYTLTSDAGHLMAQGKPFAACYWDTADKRIFSLRSTDDGMDVSEIAKQFGGGGHRNAAGFAVPRDHELAAA